MPSSTLGVKNLQTSREESTNGTKTDFWEHLEPCIIPTLSYNGADFSEKTLFPVALENVGSIGKFCEDLRISPSSFFKTAWSLVLRTYLSMDHICFTVSQTSFEGSAVASNQPTLAISSLRLNEKATTRGILQGMESRDYEPPKNLAAVDWCAQVRGVCNTIMIFTESSDEEPKDWRVCMDVGAIISSHVHCPCYILENRFSCNKGVIYCNT
jgi:hypothetical protein